MEQTQIYYTFKVTFKSNVFSLHPLRVDEIEIRTGSGDLNLFVWGKLGDLEQWGMQAGKREKASTLKRDLG